MKTPSGSRRPFKAASFVVWFLFLGVLFPHCGCDAAWSLFSSSSSSDVLDDDADGGDSDILVLGETNRSIEASVLAPTWPWSPHNVLCEAYAHITSSSGDNKDNNNNNNNELGQAFLDQLVVLLEEEEEKEGETPPSKVLSHAQATKLALSAAPYQRESLSHKLLSYSLSLRSYRPTCEMHRHMAQAAAAAAAASSLSSNSKVQHQQQQQQDAFAVVLPGGQILTEVPSDWDTIVATTLMTGKEKNINNNNKNGEDWLLPSEAVYNECTKKKHISVILYAQLGSKQFVEWYKSLQSNNNNNNNNNNAANHQVQFVVRHLGGNGHSHNHTARSSGSSSMGPTQLQGYGVRLDIRNVEYKAYEEGDDKTATTTSSSSSSMGEIPPESHRSRLGLQATAAIVSTTEKNNDPLKRLQYVSQNLPSLASRLVQLYNNNDNNVPPNIELAARMMEEMRHYGQKQYYNMMGGGGGTADFYMNGRRVPITRPSYNLFEMLDLLRKEHAKVQSLQQNLTPYLDGGGDGGSGDALKLVQSAWMQGKAFVEEHSGAGQQQQQSSSSQKQFRVDVGRGWKGAILYLNDIEKDPHYRTWPRQVQQALMALRYGGAPVVRRNLFTMLFVIDPLSPKPPPGWDLAMDLMSQSYPLRIGVLLANDADVKSLCLSSSSNNNNNNNNKNDDADKNQHSDNNNTPSATALSPDVKLVDLEKIPATARAVHTLLVSTVMNVDGMVGLQFLDGFLDAVKEHAAQNEDEPFSMYQLVSSYGQMLQGMGLTASEGTAMLQAVDLLKTGGDEEEEESLSSKTAMVATYGKGLQFLKNKALVTGTGFLNGRPMANREERTIFRKELQQIAQMIASRQITDDSPKSIYGTLLSGSRVMPKYHPLLADSKDSVDSYFDLPHGVVGTSLQFPKDSVSFKESSAIFLVQAVLNLNTARGLALGSQFLQIMESFPSKLDDETNKGLSIAYRIVPSHSSFCSSSGGSNTGQETKLDEHGSLLKSAVNELKGKACVDIDLPKNIRKNALLVNGRMFALDNDELDFSDIEILLNIEDEMAAAVTNLIRSSVPADKIHSAVSKVSTFLSIEASSGVDRMDPDYFVDEIDQSISGGNPLRFTWNDVKDDDKELSVRVAVTLDPLTEAAQRVSPFLIAIRDHLKLPLSLTLAPKTKIGEGDKIPISSYYRFVADPFAVPGSTSPHAHFSNLPLNHVLTLQMDVPETWVVQQSNAVQDTDNLRCQSSGCGDEEGSDLAKVEYSLDALLFFGQCYDARKRTPPNGLQLALFEAMGKGLPDDSNSSEPLSQVEISTDGTAMLSSEDSTAPPAVEQYSDTLVMKNVGYWQLRANPGVWNLKIVEDSRGAEIFSLMDGTIERGVFKMRQVIESKLLVMKDFLNRDELLLVKPKAGYEDASIYEESDRSTAISSSGEGEETINVFSVATGHQYERLLKIMMLSVTRRTSVPVKFWLFENFLSPSFKASAVAMAARIGCQVEFVTYKWPEWLRGQSEKQRIIWGYKILFLDVLFPLSVKKIIFVDADQVVRADLKELWDIDLEGAPYGYTPFCDSRETTLGFQFWRTGFWKNHLQGKPYHISAIYVVDLERFRREKVGDTLRSIYQQLSADPHSLANLDQDLPNYAQHQVKIFSLPQEWLWCESWCSDESKALAKTIDLCNNPLHKEAKISMAKRIISGPLFNESWVELDAEVEAYEQEYRSSLQ